MGSAYPTIAADVLARFYRLNGSDVKFVTGTDEHGEKIELAAKAGGLEPIDHCNALASQYKDLWEKVSILMFLMLFWRLTWQCFTGEFHPCRWIFRTIHSSEPLLLNMRR